MLPMKKRLHCAMIWEIDVYRTSRLGHQRPIFQNLPSIMKENMSKDSIPSCDERKVTGNDEYLTSLNKKKWLAEAVRFAMETDVMECPKCHELCAGFESAPHENFGC